MMRKLTWPSQLIALFTFSLLFSYSYQFYSQAPRFTILSHSFYLQPVSFLLIALLFFVILGSVWLSCAKILSHFFSLEYSTARTHDLFTYLPSLFLALTPLALGHYFTSDDFRSRVILLLQAVCFSILYLKAALISQWNKEIPNHLKALAQKLLGLPIRKKLAILFLTSLFFTNAGSVLLSSKGITFSGDEPHYLLIACSLFQDGDFDLTNNYAQRDYTKFTLPQVFIRPHAIPGAKPGSQYSFHSPGVAFLMLPFYALGSLLGRKCLILFLRFGLSLFGALLGLQMFLLARQEWKNEKLALKLWLVFSFTSPVFFYSIHIYPEIFIALFSLVVVRIFRFSSVLSKAKLLLCGLLLSSFVWFHSLKYLFLLVPLFLYCLWVMIKRHNDRKYAIYFLAFPLFLTGIYFYFQYSLYGSFSISSISWQRAMDSRQTLTFLREIILDIPFRYRWETLAGYFLDQRDGLLFYSPIYFFSFLGMLELIRRKARDFSLLLFLTAPYVLVSAFLTQRTGYAPQARPLVAVVWGLGICLGHFLAHNHKKIFSFLFHLAMFLSFLFVWLLIRHPLALYQETTVGSLERGGDLFHLLSNLHFSLAKFLPSFIKIEAGNWLPNFIWLGILFLFIIMYLILPEFRLSCTFVHHLLLVFLSLTLIFFWFIFYPRTVLLSPVQASWPSGKKIGFYGLSRVALMREPGKFDLLQDNRFYNFDFTSRRKIQELKIEFGSLAGNYELNLALFDHPAFTEKTAREIKTIWLHSPPSYRLKNTQFYRISIYLKNLTDTPTNLNPYLFSITPGY